MASATVDLSDFEQLRRDLAALSGSLTAEAEAIVEAAAEQTVQDVASRYRQVLQSPEETGGLLDGTQKRRIGVLAWQVFNAARHAHLFEFGTGTRTTRDTGANRGQMPAQPVFVPAAIRNRGVMVEKLKALVRRAGFEVTGDA